MHKTLRFLYFGHLLGAKICCLFENLALDYCTFTALHSEDKLSNEKQTLGLNLPSADPVPEFEHVGLVDAKVFDFGRVGGEGDEMLGHGAGLWEWR